MRILSLMEMSRRRFLLRGLGLGAGLLWGCDAQDQATPPIATPTPQPPVGVLREITPVPISRAFARPAWGLSDLLAPVSRHPTQKPYIGLTVDDGYEHRHEIHDLLVENGVNATFFVTGEIMEEDPRFVKRALHSGFEFGNHTYSHHDLTLMSKDGIVGELRRTEAALKAVDDSATTVPYLRPPFGSRTEASIQVAAELGYRSIIWNISGDAGKDFAPDHLVIHYINQIDKLPDPRGAILLTHFLDLTSYALPQLIAALRSRGLEPVPLSRLFAV